MADHDESTAPARAGAHRTRASRLVAVSWRGDPRDDGRRHVAFADDLPDQRADDTSRTRLTRLLARDGQFMRVAPSGRSSLDDGSPFLRNAIIATEDADSQPRLKREAHSGTSINDVLRANGGASTITQQLAETLPIGFEKTVERKVKEAIIAIHWNPL